MDFNDKSNECFEENSDFDSLFEPLRKAAFIDYSITIFLVLSCCPFFLYFGSNKN